MAYSFIDNSVLRLSTSQPSIIELDKEKQYEYMCIYIKCICSTHSYKKIPKLCINQRRKEGGNDLKTLKLPRINENTTF